MSRPEILETADEKEILFDIAIQQVKIGLSAIRQELTVAEAAGTIAATAVAGVLSALRNMSGRQMAVLIAQQASTGVHYTIHEPPHYTAEQIEGV